MHAIFVLFDSFVRMLTKISGWIAGIMILVTSFIITYEVLMRGLFNAPTEWSIEISVYLIIGASFLGLAPALEGNSHISVDLVTSKLRPQVNRVLHTATSVIGLIFCLILTIASVDMVMVSYEINSLSTSTLRIPLYIPQLAIPIGSAVIVLEFVRPDPHRPHRTDHAGGQLNAVYSCWRHG